jgi:hypothetical protein
MCKGDEAPAEVARGRVEAGTRAKEVAAEEATEIREAKGKAMAKLKFTPERAGPV